MAAVCPHCLRPVKLLRTPTGDRIAVDPVPRRGGALIVNGAAGRVIGRFPMTGRDSQESGQWWPHVAVCPRPLDAVRAVAR